MAKPDKDELKFVADRLVERVWQGDEAKRGLATQAASVALAAIQDHTATRYMETADEFTGRDMLNFWANRELLREARASVALDKGDGETISVEGPTGIDYAAIERRLVPGEFPGWMRTGRFEREEALERIVDEDRELLDRLAQKDGDELPDSAPKLAEVAKRERRFERKENPGD